MLYFGCTSLFRFIEKGLFIHPVGPDKERSGMKRFSSYRVTLFFLVIVLVASLQPFFAVAQTCEEPIGKMVSVQGTVEFQRAGDPQWQPVRLNDALCPGDTIRVLNNSRAEFALANQYVLRAEVRP